MVRFVRRIRTDQPMADSENILDDFRHLGYGRIKVSSEAPEHQHGRAFGIDVE